MGLRRQKVTYWQCGGYGEVIIVDKQQEVRFAMELEGIKREMMLNVKKQVAEIVVFLWRLV
jgi:hypothetical protein